MRFTDLFPVTPGKIIFSELNAFIREEMINKLSCNRLLRIYWLRLID
jgi:hypothetical protein